MKILIADDHPIFRQGLIQIVERADGEATILQASDGLEALRLLESDLPDVAILDIAMPSLTGLEILAKAREMNSRTRFIILTMYNEEEYFQEAMDLGVRGYLLKESAASEVLGAVRSVFEGKYYVSPSISHYLVDRLQGNRRVQRKHPALQSLTPTERRVLKLISLNCTSREIGRQMNISTRTVQNHRTNISLKMGLRGYNKLLHFALEHRHIL